MRLIKQLSCVIAVTALIIASPIVLAKEYALPTVSTTAVVTLDYQGNRLRRIDDAPTLTILANGDVILPQNYSHTQAYEGSLSMSELQSLLDFIIRENQFFEFDAATTKAKLSEVKRQPLPVHYTTTVISVTADNREKEVRLPALGKGPMVEETRRMLAINQRLDRLMSFVKLGGSAEVDKFLAMANKQRILKLGNKNAMSNNDFQALSAGSFTADDLEVGGPRSDGSIHVRFKRSNGTRATIDISTNGKQVVTVASDN